MRRAIGSALAATLLLGGLTACGGNSYDAYCTAVTDNQTKLATVLDADRRDAFLTALPILQDLRSKAPADIADDWTQLVTSVQGLSDALAAAHVDPQKYNPAKPPAGVTPAQRQAIKGASVELGGQQTLTALANLDQEARDVCQTSLTL